MDITQLTRSGLDMGINVARKGLENVTWLGKGVCTALSGGLSRAAGIASSVWSATSPHLARTARTATTHKGILIGGAIAVVVAMSSRKIIRIIANFIEIRARRARLAENQAEAARLDAARRDAAARASQQTAPALHETK